MEKVGIHKRDIMVGRIESTQEAQEDAQQQFKSALEQFQSVVNFDGGDLEAAYNKLNDEYESSVKAAEKVRSLESSEKRMQPVLNAFQDQVLYLKHNLNARAVSALKGEFNNIKADIDRLISEMQKSIKESRQFIAALKEN